MAVCRTNGYNGYWHSLRQPYISRLNTTRIALTLQYSAFTDVLHWSNWADHVHYKSTFVKQNQLNAQMLI